jgi:BirA family biotin operon repressor/biotin-[acetyl-CoA-carboxylase] ligase
VKENENRTATAISTMLPDTNAFDLSRIAAAPSIQSLEYRPSLGSTQDLAVELAADDDLLTPLLVLAGEQTAGRGRGRSAWWAARGALTFSLVFDSDAAAGGSGPDPRLSLAAGLALCEVIRSLAPNIDCGLKWPNDVYLAGQKVCGVLVETIGRSKETARRTVLGVGVNVNNPLREAPPEIAAAATSLFDATRRHHDLTDLLLAMLEQLGAQREALAGNQPEQIENWQSHSLLDGRWIVVGQGSRSVEGRCVGIAATGALVVDTPDGQRHLFAGQVDHIDPPLTAPL